MSGRILEATLRFEGSVTCRPGHGAVSLTLSGLNAGAGLVAHLSAADAAGLAGLPPVLQEVRLSELPAAGPAADRRFRLQARGLERELRARGLQLHRDAGEAFFHVVPPVPVPLARRVGWSVLLALLRVPGIVRLLSFVRGSK